MKVLDLLAVFGGYIEVSVVGSDSRKLFEGKFVDVPYKFTHYGVECCGVSTIGKFHHPKLHIEVKEGC